MTYVRKIKHIIILGFLLRVLTVLFLGDFTNGYYWEYGETAKNIINGKGYSLFYIENSKLEHHYKENAKPAESAYMPPGYVFFLLPFIWISDVVIRNALIYFLQIIIASFSIYLVYLLTLKLFNEKTALIAAFLSAVLPEFIYSVLSFTPTVIYHLLILYLLILLLSFKRIRTCYLYIAFLIALTIYFRSEFFLFFLMIVTFLLAQKELKVSAKIFFIVLILL